MAILKAGILVIGDEILSGRTHDTNSNFIAKKLTESGISLEEIKIIHDHKETIIINIKEFHKKYDYVFTTGGIGPTHDDITSESVSKAFKLPYERHEEGYKILESYYKPGEFNDGRQKMIWMPKGAKLILNPTSGAPGFYVENVFVLPGVPSILKSMLGGLKNKIVGGNPIISHTISLRTFESHIAESLSSVQNKYQNVEIGSYPFFHAGKLGVSIVIRSDNEKLIKECSSEVMNFVNEKKIEVVNR